MYAERIGRTQQVLTLDDLQPGEEAVISGYSEEIADELRLLEMGLIIGTVVRLVRYAPFRDPIQINVRGCNLSLRRKMARCILLRPNN